MLCAGDCYLSSPSDERWTGFVVPTHEADIFCQSGGQASWPNASDTVRVPSLVEKGGETIARFLWEHLCPVQAARAQCASVRPPCLALARTVSETISTHQLGRTPTLSIGRS
jgi:hypothetical protein